MRVVIAEDQALLREGLARLFRDGLGCPDALFLDGSVSSLWDPGAGRMDPHPALGPMLVVFAGRQEGAAGASSRPN